MEQPTYTFRFNGTDVPGLTMQEAIDSARHECLDNGRSVRLYVKNNGGSWTELALYSPIKPSAWEKFYNEPNDKDSGIIPQVNVDLRFKHSVKNPPYKIDAILHPGKKKKSDDTYTIRINGRKDPLNRVFCSSTIDGSRTAKEDLETWFKNMKDHGFYPLVDHINYANL